MLKGSNLLAGLYHQMEAAAADERIRKILQKRPQARGKADIQELIERTEDVPLLCHSGPAMHTDLCHVLKAKVLRDSEALKLRPGNGGEAFYLRCTTAADDIHQFSQVVSGKLRMSCLDRGPLETELGEPRRAKGSSKNKEGFEGWSD
ncbi:unnamed protein product [Ostreobium quekettii]|uniref:Uncharacterized protein n=1 Tax=Ostreobium quekettii TaxID=121088 RepID=A0A8S1JH95_9CHLO|nr:unnamed protein product [Ostreobium quekettii]